MIIQLDEPYFRASPGAQRVKELLYQGKSPTQIALIMRVCDEEVKDWIYEVRKEQMIMASKLTNEQRAEIYRLWKEEGVSQTDIARKFDVSVATISLVIKKINGVQDMLDTLSAADSEEEPGPIEYTTEPVEMTEEHTAAPPESVIRAVEDKIETVQELMRHNTDCIESLTRQNAECKAIIAELERWLKEAQNS